MIPDIVLQTFDIYFIVRDSKVYTINNFNYRILKEIFVSDIIPKHEINLPWALNILKVSVQIFLKPAKTFQKPSIAKNLHENG